MIGETCPKEDVDEAEEADEMSENTDPLSEPLLADESESWERRCVRGSGCGRTIGDTGAANWGTTGAY